MSTNAVTRLLALVAVAVMMAAACGGGDPASGDSDSAAAHTTPSESESSSAGSGDAPTELYEAAREYARDLVGGEPIGGHVTLLGVLGGDELEQYLSAYAPFEEATGIEVQYEGTRDMIAVLQTRVEGGNPPDAVSSASIGQMRELGASGDLVALDDILDMDVVGEDFDAGLLELGTVDGNLYGIFGTAAVKGLIYHNTTVYDGPTPPETWDELDAWARGKAEDGITPWCIGLEAGAASGWPATDWIELFLLNQSGTDVYDAWWQGELPWTSPEIEAAFEAFGEVATDPAMVNGGPTGVLSADFLTAADPLFSDPPGCLLHNQADWLSRVLPTNVDAAVQGETLDLFLFPSIEPEHAGTVEFAGEMLGIFSDSPQARAFIEYSASPERQAITASTGNWLAPNKRVDPGVYDTPLMQRSAEILVSADALRFDASDLMPAAVNEAFWTATLDYVGGAASLEEILARLEEVRVSQADG